MTAGAQKQSRRRERMTQAAQSAGYKTIDQLAQAILRGDVHMFHNEFLVSDGVNECLTNDLSWIDQESATITEVRVCRNDDGTIEFAGSQSRPGYWVEDSEGFLQFDHD